MAKRKKSKIHRVTKGPSLEAATRAVLRGESEIVKAQPKPKRLDYVTLPALACLAGIDLSAKPWRPEGHEA